MNTFSSLDRHAIRLHRRIREARVACLSELDTGGEIKTAVVGISSPLADRIIFS
jgi:hypothetical protein